MFAFLSGLVFAAAGIHYRDSLAGIRTSRPFLNSAEAASVPKA